MKKEIILLVLSYFAKIMTQGAREEIKLSFKEAIMNDFESHKLSFISIPIFIFLALQLFGAAFILTIYSLIDLYALGGTSSVAVLLTAGVVFTIAVVLSLITYMNIRYIIYRVEMMNDTMVRIKDMSSPFQKIVDQFKKENKMLLQSFVKTNPN